MAGRMTDTPLFVEEDLQGRRGMGSFLLGLFLLCASTLMYEVVLTRLMSVTCWYYLAFVSVSMAMFGMTAGALSVQLRPEWFTEGLIRRRLAQSAMATAIAMPLSLLLMLAIPVDVSLALQTIFSFVLFSAVISVPFFFSGVGVCISLTRSPFSMGRVYFTDLAGASAGCLAAVLLLSLIDAPSAIFVIAAVLFVSAAAYGAYAEEAVIRRRSLYGAALMLLLGIANASTLYGIQPIWSKGAIDHRTNILAEKWNPISKVRATKAQIGPPLMWGPSPRTPVLKVEEIGLVIDNAAGTAITRFNGDLKPLDFLRYDVTSVAAQLRSGGTGAIIGVGGGRDVLNCAAQGFTRIVGIEVNSAIVELTSKRFEWFSGFTKIPGFELHHDEGRSYLTRSGEHFDLIQASLVDTWAATSAGAMTLSENALYTVDGWKVFYEHLKPGGVIAFSRWFYGDEHTETFRLYSVARAMLMAEGVRNPEAQLALINSGQVATLLASNQPFSQRDIQKLKSIMGDMSFTPVVIPGEPILEPELRRIVAAGSLEELAALREGSEVDYSPTFDSSPYFFNAVHIKNIVKLARSGGHGANLRAILFVLGFMVAALILVMATIILPVRLLNSRTDDAPKPLYGAVTYFIAIGLGFILVEMAMMQQLSIFLGQPIYSMVVVLGGLILSAGVGSLASDRWQLKASWRSRVPALVAALSVVAYSLVVVPAIHAFTAELLWQRVLICLALISPCGFLLGFCFPVGMRWLNALSQGRNLPWMWALNGAAGTLGSFIAILISMDLSIGYCVLTGAGCYLLAGLAMPAKAT
jgi:SAM-dependent methyltransferase